MEGCQPVDVSRVRDGAVYITKQLHDKTAREVVKAYRRYLVDVPDGRYGWGSVTPVAEVGRAGKRPHVSMKFDFGGPKSDRPPAPGWMSRVAAVAVQWMQQQCPAFDDLKDVAVRADKGSGGVKVAVYVPAGYLRRLAEHVRRNGVKAEVVGARPRWVLAMDVQEMEADVQVMTAVVEAFREKHGVVWEHVGAAGEHMIARGEAPETFIPPAGVFQALGRMFRLGREYDASEAADGSAVGLVTVDLGEVGPRPMARRLFPTPALPTRLPPAVNASSPAPGRTVPVPRSNPAVSVAATQARRAPAPRAVVRAMAAAAGLPVAAEPAPVATRTVGAGLEGATAAMGPTAASVSASVSAGAADGASSDGRASAGASETDLDERVARRIGRAERRKDKRQGRRPEVATRVADDDRADVDGDEGGGGRDGAGGAHVFANPGSRMEAVVAEAVQAGAAGGLAAVGGAGGRGDGRPDHAG